MTTSIVLAAGVGLLTTLAAATDLGWRRIPNYLTVPAAVAALLFHSISPLGWGFPTAAAGLLVGMALLFIPWLVGGSGMGDVKLLAAVGAWLGPKLVLIAFGMSMVSALVLAIAIIAVQVLLRGVIRTRRRFSYAPTFAAKLKKPAPRVLPFAVPVALSSWLLLGWLLV